MAIINTLEKCLDSPYLFADAEAPARVAGLLKLAEDRFESASFLFASGKGDPADVSALAYEAMFAALRALVYAKGYREAGLKCLMLACEQFYVRPGQLDVAHIHAFEKSQGQKLTPVEAVASAGAFVVRAKELVTGQSAENGVTPQILC